MHNNNVDPQEIAKFDAVASRWWDKDSEFKALHDINPLRLGYIEKYAGSLDGKTVLDIGCGGGILTESMAQCGGIVTGIDMSEGPLEVAKLHLYESGMPITYLQTTAEQLAQEQPQGFEVITCMEMLEHVPDPLSIIRACAHLVKPGGHVFFSTLNRNPKAYLFAIIGAEYILGLLPKGSHDYGKFIQPIELAQWIYIANLMLRDFTGLSYNPITGRYWLGRDVSVNYLAYAHCCL